MDSSMAGVTPREGALWYFNLGRNQPRREEREFSGLVPTRDRHFHDCFIRARLVVV